MPARLISGSAWAAVRGACWPLNLPPAVPLALLLAAALPQAAWATPLVINSLVDVAPGGSYQLASTDTLDITATGELRADGRSNFIGLSGNTVNRGQLRAGWNVETLGGLGVAGSLDNLAAPSALSPVPTITAMRLVVSAAGSINNHGVMNTGVFTRASGDVIAFASPVDLTAYGVMFDIRAGAQVVNAGSGIWANRADGRVLGTLNNAGTLFSANLPGLVLGNGPYEQVIRVGFDDFSQPLPVRQGAVLNSGSLRLDAHNRLLNAGSFINSGTVELRGGELGNLSRAEWVNSGSFSVGAGGLLAFDRSLGPAENGGLLTVQAGGTLSITDATTRLQNLAGGQLVVAGRFDGEGRLVNRGSVTVQQGGSMSLGELSQPSGHLRMDGTLSADVRIDGGILSGGGYRDPLTGVIYLAGGTINGQVYLAGTGPAEALNACTFSSYACLKPGSSPGRLNINGELNMAEFSVLELEVERDADGALVWDQLFTDTGVFGSGSLIRILLGEDVGDLDEHLLDFIHCSNGCSFSGTQFEVVGGTGRLQASEAGLFFTLPAADNGGGTVPEPSAAALLALGLATLARGRRSARAAAGKV